MTAPDAAAHLDLSALMTFPCPGWNVLDVARNQRFTGELTCATIPSTKVYFDAGQIYFAERRTDTSLGARLVDAGALSAAQLELGSMFVGGIAHLGRLFDRVGTVDRQQVLLVTELMTEDCVAWLASELVAGIDPAPYRHHPTGIRRWSWSTPPSGPTAADSLPTPTDGPPGASDTPESTPPTPASPLPTEPLSDLESSMESYDDGTIRWDQPSWLDRGDADTAPQLAPPDANAVQFPGPAPAPEVVDHADRPEVAAPAPVSEHDPVDRFEVIWPSGEVDDQVVPHDDNDASTEPAGSSEQVEQHRSALHHEAVGGNSVDFTTDHHAPHPLPERKPWMAPSADDDQAVALAVRRAIATIETGSLEVRRRFVATPSDDDLSRGATLPERLAAPIPESMRRAPTRSVFVDADASFEPTDEGSCVDDELVADEADERVGALRRLIHSMRRG